MAPNTGFLVVFETYQQEGDCTRVEVENQHDLQLLNEYSSITEVFIKDASRQLDLTPLKKCTSLKKLIFYDCSLPSIDITPIEGNPNLETLELSFRGLTSMDFTSQIHWPSLRSLKIIDTHLTTLDLSFLSKSEDLRFLHLRNNCLDSLNLSPLRSCRELDTVNVSKNRISDIDLSPIAEHDFLSRLDISDNSLTSSLDLSFFTAPLWDGIDLSGNGLESVILSKHTYGKINLSKNRLTSIDLSPLSQMQTVEINLSHNELSEIDLSPLSNRYWVIDRDLFFGNDYIHGLEGIVDWLELDLSHNLLSTIDLTPLATIPRIAYLDISDNPLDQIEKNLFSKSDNEKVAILGFSYR